MSLLSRLIDRRQKSIRERKEEPNYNMKDT